MKNSEMIETVKLEISREFENSAKAERLRMRFKEDPLSPLTLRLDEDGLTLISDSMELRGDFTKKLHRLKNGSLQKELLVRASKIKDNSGELTAIDATAGLGEDSLLLAASGFRVYLYERNPIIFELLSDTIERALSVPELKEIAERMTLFNADSIEAMNGIACTDNACAMDSVACTDNVACTNAVKAKERVACTNNARIVNSTATDSDIIKTPDVILLDPMFPERQKSALVKKKLQVIQSIEEPCGDERELVLAAINAVPRKLVIKRPPKGPYLAGIKPDYSISGKAVRFDCLVSPHDRIEKLKAEMGLTE